MKKSTFFLGVLLPFVLAHAKPTGFQLKSGDAHLSVPHSTHTVLIQSSQNSMVDWDQFSIDLAEHIRFEQLHGNNYVLNRVVGATESTLLGTLSSNGAVYLINPNGILIGPHAQIETAGFIASTLDLLDTDLSSFSLFGTTDKGVINQGKIHCPVGDIFLIGRTVENSGTLSAPTGRQGFLSGCDVLICPDRAPQVQIRSEDPIDPEVLNENPYSLAIRHSGQISAQEIYLLAEKGISEVSGTIAASKGGRGGYVCLLGDEVRLLGQAEIEASGSRGGGEALFNARHLFVEEGVQIRANAWDEGNGGKVTLFGDEAAIYYGHIGIRGGERGGDGGFAEVSGKYLNFHGLVDGTALGAPGSVLLDPTDITISVGANANGSFSAGVWTSTAATATINTTTLQTALASSNVVINTASAFAGTGNITVSNTFTWSAATQLTLTANNNITINASISNSGAGGIVLNGAAITTNASFPVANNVTVTNSGLLSIGGSMVLTGSLSQSGGGAVQIADSIIADGSITFAGPVTLTGDVIFSAGENITFGSTITGNYDLNISAIGANVTVLGNVDLSGANPSDGGSLEATGGGGVSFAGNISTQGVGTSRPGGNVTLTSSEGSVSIQDINVSGGNGVTGGNAGAILIRPASGYAGGFPIGKIIMNGDLTALKGSGGGGNDGTITLSANRSSAATVATITSSLSGNDIDVDCGSFTMGPYEAMTALGNLSLSASSTLTLGDVVAMENLTLSASMINLLTHGYEVLLDPNGLFYISYKLHFFAGGTYTRSGTLVPDGPLNAEGFALSPAAFRRWLIYAGSTILNYDTRVPISTQFVIYQLAVASAQLSDLLPIFEPVCPPICRHKGQQSCRKFVE